MMRETSGRRTRTRSATLRYVLGIGLTVLLFAVLQVSLFPHLRFFGCLPDLMIVTVLIFAFFCGKYTGAITGICSGVLIEALGTTGISLLPVVYFLCGYIAGFYARSAAKKQYSSYLFYLALTVLLRMAVTLTYACLLYRNINLPRILLYAVLPEAAYTALAGMLLYFPIRPICRWLGRKT